MEIISEKLLEKNVTTLIKLLGGLCLKIYSTWFTGLPDRLILMPGGKIFFAEIKTTGQKLRPRQVTVIRLLSSLGFTVFVVDSKESLNTLKDHLLNQ